MMLYAVCLCLAVVAFPSHDRGSRQWAVRCMHEASMHMFNLFVTLTYDDNHLPEYNSLNYKHFQDFMKRLRKAHNGVRFYMCGGIS